MPAGLTCLLTSRTSLLPPPAPAQSPAPGHPSERGTAQPLCLQ